MSISDDGVGIFHKIQNAFGLDDPREAILELAKGKLTTDPARHTGEGIFFSSRSCDAFYIQASGLLFSGAGEEDWLVRTTDLETIAPKKAVLWSAFQSVDSTTVVMKINNNSKKTLEDIFEEFASEDEDFGFVRTHIPILLADYGADGLMSRSKAKRVVSGVGKFKEVVLDFSGVERIGQAFADEIFRVYANAHPDVNIQYMNAAPAVERLIRRALAKKDDG
ncbi:MAG: STAS-like domain-containing protein [Rhodothermales bacterium]